MLKNLPIEKFGSKLFVASKSVNKIPSEYLKSSKNARIYDGGVGPRLGKQLLTDSTLGTNNKGSFVMLGVMYQIANSIIYSVNETTGVQTSVVSLGYDALTDVLVYNDFAIIVSDGEDLEVFNGTGLETTPTAVPATNSGIIEYTRGFSFLVSDNVVYISRPITPANPEYAYDFTGSGSQQITYDSDIIGLKGTMNGLYVFTRDKIEFLGANSLQNVAGAAAFISTPLGDGGELMANGLIATSGDKIFYVTKNLDINTVNYVQGTAEAGLGELSNRPVIGIRELMETIDFDQPTGHASVNQNDNTIQFQLRTINSPFNNIVVVYDMINDTWNVDTGKNYNFVLKKGELYYGFSDVNSSIYQDDIGNSDAGIPMAFKVVTQDLNNGNMFQKYFGGFFTAGAINFLSILQYRAFVDDEEVFVDEINGADQGGITEGAGEIAGDDIGGEPIAGDLSVENLRQPFDMTADTGRIYQSGIRMRLEITSQSQIQDFLIDTLGIIAEETGSLELRNKF